MKYEQFIRVTPDFPKKGVSFKDISPLLRDGAAFKAAVADIAALAASFRPTVILGPEARGFVFGTPVAFKLGLGFIMARKEGKLPGATLSVTYGLEYGTDTIAIPDGLLTAGDRVVLVDDLLATGGTLAALARLIRQTGAATVGAVSFIELAGLGGAAKLEEEGVPFKAPLLL